MLQDHPSGVDDLIEAKAVHLKAMELSTLIAKNKTTIAEPDQSTISKSVNYPKNYNKNV